MFSNANEITACLNVFQRKIETNEWRIRDRRLPSLNIRCFYNEYCSEILKIYSLEHESDLFVRLFDACEMDSFSIEARSEEEIARSKALSYIERVKNKIIEQK